MNANNGTTTRLQRLQRDPEGVGDEPTARLDAMRERSAGEVLGILRQGRAASPEAPNGVPTGLWKTGWLAQPEGAA